MVLIFGASYGILVASKLMLAGYNVTCVCKKEEADLMNEKGFFVEFEGYKNEKIIINSNNLIGKIKAVEPHEINLDNLKVIVEETGDTLDVELPENLKNASIQYEKSVNIYPNPARNQLFVEHDKQGALEESFIEIYNLQGQLLIEAKLLGAFGTIDISKLENGVYGVKVWDKHKREFIPKKILKI